ncbi:hypothetical protein V8C86DRAFT_3032332 [Haematococcus lacustris]
MAWITHIKLRQKGSTLQMLQMHHAASSESVQPHVATDGQQGEQGEHEAGIAAFCHCLDSKRATCLAPKRGPEWPLWAKSLAATQAPPWGLGKSLANGRWMLGGDENVRHTAEQRCAGIITAPVDNSGQEAATTTTRAVETAVSAVSCVAAMPMSLRLAVRESKPNSHGNCRRRSIDTEKLRQAAAGAASQASSAVYKAVAAHLVHRGGSGCGGSTSTASAVAEAVALAMASAFASSSNGCQAASSYATATAWQTSIANAWASASVQVCIAGGSASAQTSAVSEAVAKCCLLLAVLLVARHGSIQCRVLVTICMPP